MKLEIVIILLIVVQLAITVEFSYPSYTFRRKSSQAKRYKERERICRINTCSLKDTKDYSILNLDQLKCIRKCVSQVCYDELYAWNELEEGEIDVRSNSFKGCFCAKLRAEQNKASEL